MLLGTVERNMLPAHPDNRAGPRLGMSALQATTNRAEVHAAVSLPPEGSARFGNQG
jgi:hypothetical protein